MATGAGFEPASSGVTVQKMLLVNQKYTFLRCSNIELPRIIDFWGKDRAWAILPYKRCFPWLRTHFNKHSGLIFSHMLHRFAFCSFVAFDTRQLLPVRMVSYSMTPFFFGRSKKDSNLIPPAPPWAGVLSTYTISAKAQQIYRTSFLFANLSFAILALTGGSGTPPKHSDLHGHYTYFTSVADHH